MDIKSRQHKIDEHRAAIRALEGKTEASRDRPEWPPPGYYPLWHVVIGMMLGALGATVSLVGNILGAPLFGQRRLELIRVYMTFPMGERALALDDGTLLFVGCLLYLVTGALYGILIHLVLSLYYSEASAGRRFLVATAIGLGRWVVNFYLVLSWLQPMLLGGDWIARLVPPWVGALTHLAFAWTVAAAESLGWGRFEPYARSGSRGSAAEGGAR